MNKACVNSDVCQEIRSITSTTTSEGYEYIRHTIGQHTYNHTITIPMLTHPTNQSTITPSTLLSAALTAPTCTLLEDPVAVVPPAFAAVAVVGPGLSKPGAVNALGNVTSALILANCLLAAALLVL